MIKYLKKFVLLFLINIVLTKVAIAENINEIKIYGNDRISIKTIILFSDAKLNDNVDENKLDVYLKNLYETNFFKNIKIKFENNILSIFVEEEPLYKIKI